MAARLGRILDWACKGKRILDMGVHIFAVCAHVHAAAIDHRTNQDAADKLGNSSRALVNRIAANSAANPGLITRGRTAKAATRNANARTLGTDS